jgi:hypothetical protein
MNRRTMFTVGALALVSWSGVVWSQPARAITLEEAQTLSQQTGRPIFAVAGSET